MQSTLGTSLITDRDRRQLTNELESGNLRKRDDKGFVTDKQGRRRFHGAFTGGFSAGYFNTVGSEEGWTPSTFKSSRQSRSTRRIQRPQDFMDDDDDPAMGQALSVAKEYREEENNKHQRHHSRGLNALESTISPVNFSIGKQLLRQLGWREGQGIGPKERVPLSGRVMDDGTIDPHAAGYKFAPKNTVYRPVEPKNNVYGLGFVNKGAIVPTNANIHTNASDFSRIGSRLGLRNEDDDIYDDTVNQGQVLYINDMEDRQPLLLENRSVNRGGMASTLALMNGNEMDTIFDSLEPETMIRKKNEITFYPPPDIPKDFISKPNLEPFTNIPKSATAPKTSQTRGILLGEKPQSFSALNARFSKASDAVKQNITSLSVAPGLREHVPTEELTAKPKVKTITVRPKIDISKAPWVPERLLSKRFGLKVPDVSGIQFEHKTSSVQQPAEVQPKVQKPKQVDVPEFQRASTTIFDSVFNSMDSSESDMSSDEESEYESKIPRKEIRYDPQISSKEITQQANSMFEKLASSQKAYPTTTPSSTNSVSLNERFENPSSSEKATPRHTIQHPRNFQKLQADPSLPSWVNNAIVQSNGEGKNEEKERKRNRRSSSRSRKHKKSKKSKKEKSSKRMKEKKRKHTKHRKRSRRSYSR